MLFFYSKVYLDEVVCILKFWNRDDLWTIYWIMIFFFLESKNSKRILWNDKNCEIFCWAQRAYMGFSMRLSLLLFIYVEVYQCLWRINSINKLFVYQQIEEIYWNCVISCSVLPSLFIEACGLSWYKLFLKETMLAL